MTMELAAREDAERILKKLEGERGYLLSYHVVLAYTAPKVLERYGDLYRELTLTRHQLNSVECELIWTGLLASIREHVGTIHVDRARAAGASEVEIMTAVRVAALSDSWSTLSYAASPWGVATEKDIAKEYISLLLRCSESIRPSLALLIALVVQGAQRQEQPFNHLLGRLVAEGVSDAEIAESIGYLLQPCGANTLLWATDTWFSGLRAGLLPPSTLFGMAEWKTRAE